MEQRIIGHSVADQLGWLVQRLLGLLSTLAVVGESGNVSRFRGELQLYRAQLAAPRPGEALDAVTRKCLALCQDYFQGAQRYRLDRESEYASIIDMLREALNLLTDGKTLSGAVITSAQRFRELAEVQDVHELKRRIASEVQVLEQAAREQQARSSQTIDMLNDRIRVLETKLAQTQEQLSRTEEETFLDPLTQVPNRRYFDYELERWIAAPRQYTPFVLAMVDVDNFKKVNDAYGHQVGDRVLFGIAQSMRKIVRNEDVLARYGGEEFALLLRRIPIDRAELRAQRLLDKVRSTEYQFSVGHNVVSLRMSVSCGLTDYVPGDSQSELLSRADAALYLAKRRGKDRVEIGRKSRSPVLATQERDGWKS